MPERIRNNPKYGIRKVRATGKGVYIIRMTPNEIDTPIVIHMIRRELLSQAFESGDFALM